MSTAQASTERRAREYETIYILRSKVDPDEADRVAGRVKEVIADREGLLLQVDNWGRRKLAYPIEKASRGVFVYLRYVGFEDLVAELERNLGLVDDVVRFQTILLKSTVASGDYQVDDSSLTFERVEVAAEEEEPSVAQRLGLIERPRAEGYSSRDEDEDDGMGDDDDVQDDGDRGNRGDDEEESA
jgi:small subunit ribosomal protein S6